MPLRLSASPASEDKRAAEVAILTPLCEATGRLTASVLNAHHRIRGEMFIPLHPWLGKFYEALGDYGDQLNERVEAIGGTAPVPPGGESMPRDGMEICHALHERLSALLDAMGTARDACTAAKLDDGYDLLTNIIRPLTEKWGWRLSATIDDGADGEPEDGAPSSRRGAGEAEHEPAADGAELELLHHDTHKPAAALMLTSTALDRVRTRKLGDAAGYAIWLVDGTDIRNTFHTAFAKGGNHGRYAYIPAGEVWIDKALADDPIDLAATILHHRLEAEMMVSGGKSYTAAHAAALTAEKALRAELAKDPKATADLTVEKILALVAERLSAAAPTKTTPPERIERFGTDGKDITVGADGTLEV